jgi:hypothetical protein
MLKAYAVALVLTTATPVSDNKQVGADQAPKQTTETATQTNTWKPRTNGIKL